MSTRLQSATGRRRGGQSGQGLVEYSAILTLISVVSIALLVLLGGSIQTLFSHAVIVTASA